MTTPPTINLTSAQVGITRTVTLNVSGGSGSYKWTTSPPSSGTNPVELPPSLTGATCTITGNCFGLATVTVEDTSTGLTATASISVGSVTIAGPDGNYYHCFPSGATVQVDASTLFTQLGSPNVFGDATNGTIYDVSRLETSTSNPSTPTTQATAVTCYLLNLKSFTTPRS